MIIGRTTELATIASAIEQARDGTGRSLLLIGEPGMGKTSLLKYAEGLAKGFRVLHLSAVEPERDFPFAGLHELLLPELHRLSALPDVQAEALRGALALAESRGSVSLTIGAGVLSMLSAVATERPVLCLIDDVHWLDQASTDALTFAARRFHGEPVVMLFAGDDAATDLVGVATEDCLVLTGLSELDAKLLVVQEYGDALVPNVVDAVVQASGGNPFVLREAPLLLNDEQRSGRMPLPEPMPIPAKLTRSLATQLSGLSPAARDALLCAAAAGTRTFRVIAETDETAVEGMTEVEEVGLVDLSDGQLAFTHPLTAAIVYQTATPAERRIAHRRISISLGDEERYRERRAWHLAAAAVEPDEELATALAEAAAVVRECRGQAAAAALFETSARLSVSPEQRTLRTVEAARSAWLAGQTERAAQLVGRLPSAIEDERLRAKVTFLRAELSAAEGRLDEHLTHLAEAASHLAPIAPIDAVPMLMLASRGLTGHEAIETAQGAADLAADLPPNQAGVPLLALVSAYHRDGDYDRSAKTLSRVAALTDATGAGQLSGELLVEAVAALTDCETSGTREVAEFFDGLTDAARRDTAVAMSAVQLLHAGRDLLSGQWQGATVGFFHAHQLALETGQREFGVRALLGSALLAALQDRTDDNDQLLKSELGLEVGVGRLTAARDFVAAMRLLGNGLADQAAELLQGVDLGRAQQVLPPGCVTLVDLVEATTRSEGRSAGAAVLDARQGGNLDARQLLWARALVADDFRPMFLEAIGAYDDHDQARPFCVARIRLGLGERLRRDNHRTDSREHLRLAHEAFEQLGAVGWASMARRELKAAGETARRRNAGGVEELTAQELQVAQVLATGATYKEAAARLYLSPKTIEFHVGKVYRKLGIGSRRDLAARLAQDGES